MRNEIQRIGAMLATVMLPLLVTCDGAVTEPGLQQTPDRYIAEMSIEPDDVVLYVGEAVRLFAQTMTRDGTPLGPYETVQWSSSNTGVVRVREDGVVEAVRRGDAEVRADCGRHNAIANVKVIARKDELKEERDRLKR